MRSLLSQSLMFLVLLIFACEEDNLTDPLISNLANSAESLPTTVCSTLTARYSPHAMWMGKYKGGKSAHFTFENQSGSVEFFEDSTGHINGTLVMPDRPDDKWNIDVWIAEPKDWHEWSSLGRSYKGDREQTANIPPRTVGNLFQEWTYYVFDNTKPNRLIGKGINTGDTLELRLYPWDLNFGLQIGYAANDKNHNLGLSAWFTYFWEGRLFEGDFNFDLECPGISTHIPTNVEVTTIAGGRDIDFDPNDGQPEEFFGGGNGLCVDTKGNLFVARGTRIVKVTPDGTVTSFAGGTRGTADGKGSEAQFLAAIAITIDEDGHFYVLDGPNIRKITPEGEVTTFLQNFTRNEGWPGFGDIAVDSEKNIYIADARNSKIRKIIRGTDHILAGSIRGFADGPAASALFSFPRGIALDEEGNVFVADAGNNRIRKISVDRVVSTFAGGLQGYENGPRLMAKFKFPIGVAFDTNGNLYVADRLNYRIRNILPDGDVITLAGTEPGFTDVPPSFGLLPVAPGEFLDGPGTIARFWLLNALTIDDRGTLYVDDHLWVRKITQ